MTMGKKLQRREYRDKEIHPLSPSSVTESTAKTPDFHIQSILELPQIPDNIQLHQIPRWKKHFNNFEVLQHTDAVK